MSDTALTVLGMSFIFVMTTAGSSIVYFFKNQISEKANTLFLGFASGIMIAASVWSLLIPAIEQASAKSGKIGLLPVAIGFIVGGLFLVALDYAVPHMHTRGEEEGPRVSVKKSVKLFLAVTIHNIPEGLAVGFAFGAAAAMADHSAYISALGLAIGVGVQNFPEGAAVSLPLKTETGSKNKAFLYGMGSGAVEPVFAVIGFFLTSALTSMQPWLMAFAAGAMIFVVAEDLIPDAKLETNPHLGTWGVMAGFVVMMILDVSLG
ncbi:MAG: ZIP family metal transporter [Eubacteriales bacterium]|jgi:ZIP family zinc transporter|nr:ZIP family metal transporter [Faecalibacterium sp.]MDY6150785.1 ZIP family metal transporter [Eubacteriales bacterium]